MQKSSNKRLLIILLSIFIPLALIVTACGIYLCTYYPAEESAMPAFSEAENISVSYTDGGDVVFSPEGATVGIIFYPGGKVEHNAYQPLMAALAREGILTVLVKMPFNLAVFDMNAADGIREQHPEIERWYIGGHSLGGSMAASYIDSHRDDFEGLILLGSYSTADLSDSGLRVITVYGSEDEVMNGEKYEECLSNLPEDFEELVIVGGCHAYFGAYGAQDGDGTPFITPEEQIRITTEGIIALINNIE